MKGSLQEPSAPLAPDYEVGFGKPPKSTRFKPGQSGNKKGRPKGSKSFTTDLKDMLASKTVVTSNGKPKKLTTQQASLERLRHKALQGDARALNKIIDLAQQMSEEEQDKTEARSITKEDSAILERFLARQNDGGVMDDA